jgi:DNA repair exonuclease SbcCD ATPase subunit
MDKIILNEKAIVNRIFFLSDVHIKNSDSENTIYYHVFDNLFKELTARKVGKNDLIVLTGDIMDCGYHLTPNAIVMVQFLYHNLTNFCNVINILGNHEYKLEIDTLTPLVGKHFMSKNKNHFLLENKVYIYGNIAFGHTRFDSNIVTSCAEYNDKYTTIGLFHGCINGASFDNNFIARAQFSMKDFKDYKYCAFGDLHKQQWLRKDNTAFYAGSTIQQKINEGIRHGMVCLDVYKGKTEFIEIQNDYKQLDLTMDNNGNLTNFDMESLALNTKYADIRISFEKTNDKMIEKIKQQFEDNGITITNCKKKPTFGLINIDTSIKIGKKTHKLTNIKTKDDFTNFFYNYVISKHTITDKKKMKLHINELVYESINDDDLMMKKNINILDIKINNLLIYGNTELNIENITGVLGVCQSNSFGKSSMCEMISLILFGKTPRCEFSKSFIRRGQIHGSGTIKMVINDIEYEITRTIKLHGTIKTATCANTLLEFKKIENKATGQHIIYVGDKKYSGDVDDVYKYKPLKEIQTMICDLVSYDEVYSMIVVSQDRENSFLKTPDKVDLLFKISNLGYIDKVSQKCNTDLGQTKRSITMTIKKYVPEMFLEGFNIKSGDKENCQKYVDHIEKKIQEIGQSSTNNMADKFDDIALEYESQKNEIIKYEERLKSYSEFVNIINNVDEIDGELVELNNNKLKNAAELKTLVKTQKEKQKQISTLNKKILVFGDIENTYQVFEQEKKVKINDTRKQINTLSKKIRNCENIAKKDYTKAKIEKNKCEDELVTMENTILILNAKNQLYENPKQIFLNYKLYLELENEFIVCNKTIELCELILEKASVKKLATEINKIKKRKAELEIEILKYVEYKNDYDEYDPSEDILNELTKSCTQRDDVTKKINKYESQIKNYETLQENEKLHNEIIKLEQICTEYGESELENYNEYCEVVNEMSLLQKSMNEIEISIEKFKNKNDKIINTITKYEHELKIIKDNVDKYEKYNDLKIEYENFLKLHKNVKLNYDKIKKEKDMIAMKNKNISEQIIIAQNIIQKCKDDIHKVNDYEIINDSLKNNGLYDTMIKKIVENLQSAINDMCEFIGHEKININLSIRNMKYDIIINTEKIPDISNAGGFQSKIMELLFKMAFLKINSYFKSDFIIIDEIFDACSEENKPMAIKLVEFFKMTYKKMLVVSHNPSIIELFDQRLNIHYDTVNGNTMSY